MILKKNVIFSPGPQQSLHYELEILPLRSHITLATNNLQVPEALNKSRRDRLLQPKHNGGI